MSSNNLSCTAQEGGSTIPDVVATALDITGLTCNEADYKYRVEGEKAFITEYTGSDAAILLPATLGGYPVTGIDGWAFYENATLETVCCSETITAIGECAFANCEKLQAIYLPSTLQSIGSWAFSNCAGLTDLDFPNGLTTIGSEAFYGCTGLTAIELRNLR